jgi:ABC-type Mn2+/Zn2+ transport system ATPase subunit
MMEAFTFPSISPPASRFDCVISYYIILLILNLTLGPSIPFSGKTTLLNLIMGKIRPIHGSVTINSGLRIGHFTQHHTDSFDLTFSAVENMIRMFPGAEDQGMRAFLGQFQIQGNDALKPMGLLSGGQKSRVAFAALAYKKPHVLVIDEGSNHLSMDAADALVEAVQNFKGGLMVVSHDQHFVSACSRFLDEQELVQRHISHFCSFLPFLIGLKHVFRALGRRGWHSYEIQRNVR